MEDLGLILGYTYQIAGTYECFDVPSETFTQRRDGSYSLERESLQGQISKSAQKNLVIEGHRTASILSTRDSRGTPSSNAEIMEIMSSSACTMFKHRTFHASQAEISSSWELTTAPRFLRITPACSSNWGNTNDIDAF